jgi:glycerophosphoryl diester phosphodiesterase
MRGIELIAHRGASWLAPENTLAAFRLAWEEGADGIEGDFRLTGDGEIVCLHDATTGRTAGVDFPVDAATLKELRELDVGTWKGEGWAGERVPTLGEVIATVPPGKRLFMELKSGPEIIPPLAAILAGSGLHPEQAVILAFDAAVVAAAKRQFPRIKRLWLTDYKWEWRKWGWAPSIEEVLRTLAETGADGLGSSAHRSVDAGFVRALRAAGKELHVWTVDDPRHAAGLCALGVDSITTNRPGWLRCRLQNAAG